MNEEPYIVADIKYEAEMSSVLAHSLDPDTPVVTMERLEEILKEVLG